MRPIDRMMAETAAKYGQDRVDAFLHLIWEHGLSMDFDGAARDGEEITYPTWSDLFDWHGKAHEDWEDDSDG